MSGRANWWRSSRTAIWLVRPRKAKTGIEVAESNFRATEGATIPEAVVKAQTDLEAARQARDSAKKVLDSREQLFKDGALAARQVDESRLAYVQAAGPISGRRAST